MTEKYDRRAVSVEVELNDEQMKLLRQTQDAYKLIYDEHAKWFVESRTTNKNSAHSALYQESKRLAPQLPTSLIQCARDQASESIKSYNSRFPYKKWRKTPQLSEAKTIRLDRRTSGFEDGLFSFSAVNKRQCVPAVLPDWFAERYDPEVWTYCAATIGIAKNDKVLVKLLFRAPHGALKTKGKTVGIDRGIHSLAYTSEGGVFGGKSVRANRRKHAYTRKTLQQKGTPSAKRRLRKLSGKEKRFMLDINHCVSKRLAQDSTVKTYVLEDLDFKDRKSKGRRLNKWLSDWAHAQFLDFLSYKSRTNGIEIVLVNPRYTSQECNECGHIDKKNRVKDRFHCLRCGHSDHADLNAARNIRDRHLSQVQ